MDIYKVIIHLTVSKVNVEFIFKEKKENKKRWTVPIFLCKQLNDTCFNLQKWCRKQELNP